MEFIYRSKHATRKSHAPSAFGPRTLCGRALTPAWTREEVRVADESTVECSRCRTALRIIADAKREQQ